jgi:hypothetical protein
VKHGGVMGEHKQFRLIAFGLMPGVCFCFCFLFLENRK